MGDLRRETSMKKLSMALLNAAKGSEVLWILMQLKFQKRRYFQIATTVQCWNKTPFPVLGLAGCHGRKMENCRYTEVINLRFPHCGIASLAQVSTMGLCPLLLNGNEVKTIVMQENNIQMAAEHRSFTSFQMVHTHTHTRPEPGQTWKARGRKKADTRRANGQKLRRGGGEQTDLRNQPTRRKGPDQNSAHT